MTTDLQIVADAKADGFMDCLAMRNALGWDKPKANGTYYSSMGVAYRWLREAGEETVYLIPDGYTDVPKTKRTGCYPDVFARVLAYKEAVYARRRHTEWHYAMREAVHAREQEGAITKNMNWDVYIEALGPEPEYIPSVLEVVEDQRADALATACREYTGPVNRKGYPKRRPFAVHLRAYTPHYFQRSDVKDAWDTRNEPAVKDE